ncbi:putative endoribonuclease [Gluconacetobacter diazotrophicus PA1 5]|nr:putative endoribonuclease [Gluconacetobacter diazotrophicus PA1 5]
MGQDIHVRHLTGIDPTTGRPAPNLVEQCRIALDHGAAILARDGYAMQDVTRIVFMLRDTDAFSTCFPLLREAFGTGRPATTLRRVPGFTDAATLIEIELVVSSAAD